MVTCLNAMGKKVTKDEVLAKFHRIDKDGNYEVDYQGKCLSMWAVLHKKVPNHLSRCHTKRRTMAALN